MVGRVQQKNRSFLVSETRGTPARAALYTIPMHDSRSQCGTGTARASWELDRFPADGWATRVNRRKHPL